MRKQTVCVCLHWELWASMQLPCFCRSICWLQQVSEGKNQNSLGGFTFIKFENVGAGSEDSFIYFGLMWIHRKKRDVKTLHSTNLMCSLWRGQHPRISSQTPNPPRFETRFTSKSPSPRYQFGIFPHSRCHSSFGTWEIGDASMMLFIGFRIQR